MTGLLADRWCVPDANGRSQERAAAFLALASAGAGPGRAGDVGRQPRRLTWEPRALDALEQLAEYMGIGKKLVTNRKRA